MSRKNISQEKIIQAFISCAFDKSAGATSLADISDILQIKKASLYNHFENRDSMYEAAIDFCKKEINSISFLTDNILDSIKNGKSALIPTFKKLTTRFFNLYETEPLVKMYVFIHTEQYFTPLALESVHMEEEKLNYEIRRLLQAFSDVEKFSVKAEKDLKEIAQTISCILIQQRDIYIANLKETIRQNPESGAGSLFALPTDDLAVGKTFRLIENFLKLY
ncbi:MAG: TetR/AcrR family transcriptional regulator [Treponema sp.]|nr:TetR/AcrR family transcriptional regulator [Treponema sp.]